MSASPYLIRKGSIMKIITGLIALRGALCLVLFSIAAYGVFVNVPEGYTYISFLLDMNQTVGVGAQRWMMTDFGSGIPLLVFGLLFLANRKIEPAAIAICAPLALTPGICYHIIDLLWAKQQGYFDITWAYFGQSLTFLIASLICYALLFACALIRKRDLRLGNEKVTDPK